MYFCPHFNYFEELIVELSDNDFCLINGRNQIADLVEIKQYIKNKKKMFKLNFSSNYVMRSLKDCYSFYIGVKPFVIINGDVDDAIKTNCLDFNHSKKSIEKLKNHIKKLKNYNCEQIKIMTGIDFYDIFVNKKFIPAKDVLQYKFNVIDLYSYLEMPLPIIVLRLYDEIIEEKEARTKIRRHTKKIEQKIWSENKKSLEKENKKNLTNLMIKLSIEAFEEVLPLIMEDKIKPIFNELKQAYKERKYNVCNEKISKIISLIIIDVNQVI